MTMNEGVKPALLSVSTSSFAVMQETNPPMPSVDFDLLNSIFDSDPGQVREVLDLYVEQSAAQIQNMYF